MDLIHQQALSFRQTRPKGRENKVQTKITQISAMAFVFLICSGFGHTPKFTLEKKYVHVRLQRHIGWRQYSNCWSWDYQFPNVHHVNKFIRFSPSTFNLKQSYSISYLSLFLLVIFFQIWPKMGFFLSCKNDHFKLTWAKS